MKIKAVITIIIIAVCCLSGPVAPASTSADEKPKIKWYDYKDGLEASEAENKIIFLTFYADWCTYCKLMDQKTFTDASVVSNLNKDFVPIKVNSDKEREIAKMYRVTGLPDSWFISEKGILGRRPGFIPPEMFLKILDAVKKQRAGLK